MASPPYATMLLDRSTWDLVADVNGNWAVAAPPYAVAQDASSEVRTFQGEVYYDTARGLPYVTPQAPAGQILARAPPPVELTRAHVTAAALTVPGAAKAKTFFTSLDGRVAAGQIQVIDVDGNLSVASF